MITGVTILGTEGNRKLVFIPTSQKIDIPKQNLTKDEQKLVNQEIYLNCMYLKKHLAR